MRLSLVQNDIIWADKNANLTAVQTILTGLAGKTDLVVLPEMFTTGFCTDRLELAENMNGKTVKTLISWAKQFQMAIAGSFIAEENNKVFNRSFFVFPTGEFKYTDKRHLFSMGGEQNHFSAGTKRLIVNYSGFNICILVCYDIRFPVWSRNVNNEYDLLVYTASFPEKRIKDWDVLLRARAIENQAYVCGVNRIGDDEKGIHYSGHSVLLDYKANVLLNYPDNETSVQTYNLDIEPLKKYRTYFPAWKDADRFEVESRI